MARFRGSRNAFGGPGIAPRWTQGNKDGAGTAYSGDSRVWFTLWNGCVTEVFYPTIDRAQIRDLQYMVSDGQTFFHEEKRDMRSVTERLPGHALAYRITNLDPAGRYRIVKDVIATPHLPCVLLNTRFEGLTEPIAGLHLYTLCAPHLQVGGWNNNAYVIEADGRPFLVAEKEAVWLAVGATLPFSKCSCGYVGASDGWTDLAENYQMDWDFDQALDGNVALTGELALNGSGEFTLGLAFGDGMHAAVTTLLQALSTPFGAHAKRYEEQWYRPCQKMLPLNTVSGDGGGLYHSSYDLLLAHEDKIFAGAFIAPMSIPWGEARSDEDTGGYHLVWTRDMVNSATGLMAAGHTETPLRALIYLSASQREDGGFPQNFWVNGEPYRVGIQLDEVAFPIILAWRLHEEGALGEFDPYPMVLRGARYLIEHGPATQQERWEEASGYSPSTLASNIAALACAASLARDRHDVPTADFLEEYADFLECHVETWTVTTDGTLDPEIKKHFIRVHPVDVKDPHPAEDPNAGILAIANVRPGRPSEFPAKEIVDPGFLELVRYGIRKPDDAIVVDSLRVVDRVLKVDTPAGPCWRRYNHDGYGQRADGGPYHGWGKGRAWPLLTGERAHYELSAGRDVSDLVRAIERFASTTGLLPEQVWDENDRPSLHMFLGKPTGAAMPLMWAHAEYVKLLRSVRDGRVFDQVQAVAQRYLADRGQCRPLEIWKANRQPGSIKRGFTLRVQAPGNFTLLYSLDGWSTQTEAASSSTSLGIGYVDLVPPATQDQPVRFTFLWPAEDRREGREYQVEIAG